MKVVYDGMNSKEFFTKWGEMSCRCYNTPLKHAERVGRHCLEHKHFSGCRDIYFRFHIDGISRACATQLNRHEVGVAKNQVSLRYTEPSGYVIPTCIENYSEAKAVFEEAMESSLKHYRALLELLESECLNDEQARENARAVLPLSTATGGVWSFTLEGLINLANKRLCARAQDEIRALVQEMVRQITEQIPELKPYLVPTCKYIGVCPEGNNGCKET